MAVDVLLATYGPQEANAGWLRTAIDSLFAYAQNLGNVVVAGTLPMDLPSNIVRFPVPPMIARGSRYDNAIDCVLRAIEEEVVSGDFLYAPPGAALTTQTDLAEYPRYMRRDRIQSVADLIRENKGGAVVTRYKLVLSDTRAALERNGYPAHELTGRFFTHIDAADAPEAKRIWLEEPHGEFGYDVSCLFGNIRHRRSSFSPVQI